MTTFTLGEILNPNHNFYVCLGTYARVLQRLMLSDEKYREEGKWGSCGPHEILCGYYGCTNSSDQSWHSLRRGASTWDEHKAQLRDDLLSAVLTEGGIYERWRKEQKVSLDMAFRFNGEEHRDAERAALERFWKLSGHNVSRAINDCHPRMRTVCFPQFLIGRDRIGFTVSISSRTEIRTSGLAASRWSLGSFFHEWERGENRNEWVPRFSWKPARETMAVALDRYADQILAL